MKLIPKNLVRVWIIATAQVPHTAVAADVDMQKLLERSRRESVEQIAEWNRFDDTRTVWDLQISELMATSDNIFGNNPTASEVIGNFAAGRNGVNFNIAEQVSDQRPATGVISTPRGMVGDHTMIALFENYRRSRRWGDAINRFLQITKNRRVDSIPESVRSAVAEAYERLGQKRSQLRILESIALNFPLSLEAIESFAKINTIRCSNSDPRLSEAFLQRMARQDVPGSGTKEFILAALKEPVERRDQTTSVISGVDLLAFYARAGYLDEAKVLGDELMNEGKLDSKQEMRLLVTMSKVYEDSSDIGKAIAQLHTFLEKFPLSSERPNIIFAMGELLTKQQNFLGAANLFASIKRRKLARPTGWMEFFSRYQAGDFERAELILRDSATLEQLDPKNPGSREYWAARTWEQLGRQREAIPHYVAIARTYALSYYAFAALARLRDLSQTVGVVGASSAGSIASLPGGSTLADADLVFAAQVDPANRIANDRDTETSDGPKIASMIGGIESSLDIAGFAENFPRPYLESVQAASDRIGVDPLVMYSIMRAESRFKPGAMSLVGAVGLLQIMPYTGSKIARLIGDEFYRADELGIPGVNISYGAFYFNFLLQNLENLPMAIAAYNAGPRAVLKWYREQQPKDMDLFIERIPFRETRKYVKEVLANLFGYERLYRGKVSLIEMQNLPSSLPELDHLF